MRNLDEIEVTGWEPIGFSLSGEVRSFNPTNQTSLVLLENGAVAASIVIESQPQLGPGEHTQPFTFTGLASGTYTLVVTKAGHLSFTILNIEIDGANVDLRLDSRVAVRTIRLLAGDVNGDGRIDAIDVNGIMANLGRPASQVSVLFPFADVNGDGVVDMQDLLIVNSNFNRFPIVIN